MGSVARENAASRFRASRDAVPVFAGRRLRRHSSATQMVMCLDVTGGLKG
jgi:hypothetical protein